MNTVTQSLDEYLIPSFEGFPITYLQIGDFDDTEWMLQNVLTHPKSEAIVIDSCKNSVFKNLTKGTVDLCRVSESQWLLPIGYMLDVYKLLRCPKRSTPGGMLVFDDVDTDLTRAGIKRFLEKLDYQGIVIEWKHYRSEGWRKV